MYGMNGRTDGYGDPQPPSTSYITHTIRTKFIYTFLNILNEHWV